MGGWLHYRTYPSCRSHPLTDGFGHPTLPITQHHAHGIRARCVGSCPACSSSYKPWDSLRRRPCRSTLAGNTHSRALEHSFRGPTDPADRRRRALTPARHQRT